MQKWPKTSAYQNRFFVPDLSPEQRPGLMGVEKGEMPRLVFVAESPFESEVRPDLRDERRPLCGKAGQEWWKMISLLMEQKQNNDTSLARLLGLCRLAQIAVLNAVQYPLDPKITNYYGPEADPIAALGFSKTPPKTYKTLRKSVEVQTAIDALEKRLAHPKVASLPIVSLGNDAQWFVTQALKAKAGEGRHLETIPHPSAWWRSGGKFREKAHSQLQRLLRGDPLQDSLHGGGTSRRSSTPLTHGFPLS